MAYYTGAFTTFAGLRAAIISACTAEGWAQSGNVLHKGDCHVELAVTSLGGVTDSHLNLKIGNGIDGANELTDKPDDVGVRMGYASAGAASFGTPVSWAWPATYHIHIHADPDEVYVVAEYNGDYFQHLMFGCSPLPGNAGTGNWMHGTWSTGIIGGATHTQPFWAGASAFGAWVDGNGTNNAQARHCIPGPFWQIDSAGSFGAGANSYIHGAIDNTTGAPGWSDNYTDFEGLGSPNRAAVASVPARPLMSVLPNLWNYETALLPCQILTRRVEGKTSLIGELDHLRFTRNDYLPPGQIIEYGPDRWKVYPFYRRNVEAGGGGVVASGNHSACLAVAIRYDGA